jgi:hypothetical protein
LQVSIARREQGNVVQGESCRKFTDDPVVLARGHIQREEAHRAALDLGSNFQGTTRNENAV